MEIEKIIKSKTRVQLHGEVFTPKNIVKKMLDTKGIKEETINLTSTFLEPAAGEGAFLVEILERKLNVVKKEYNRTLRQYENYSLFVLSTLYGIELLRDNLTACTLNLYEVYYKHYLKIAETYEKIPKDNILDSAKLIIRKNIVQGDFLLRKTDEDKEIVFSEWKPTKLGNEGIKINRTEYTLNEIYNKIDKRDGSYADDKPKNTKQLNFFNEDEKEVNYKYKECLITQVNKELMEGEKNGN